MAGILRATLYKIRFGLRRIQKLLAALPEKTDRNECVQEDISGLAVSLEAAGYVSGGVSPPRQSAEDVELDCREQDLAFPVVAELEDVGK